MTIRDPRSELETKEREYILKLLQHIEIQLNKFESSLVVFQDDCKKFRRDHELVESLDRACSSWRTCSARFHDWTQNFGHRLQQKDETHPLVILQLMQIAFALFAYASPVGEERKADAGSVILRILSELYARDFGTEKGRGIRVVTMIDFLKAARQDWLGLLVTLRIEKNKKVWSGEGTAQFTYKPFKVVLHKEDGTVEVQSFCIECTIASWQSTSGTRDNVDEDIAQFGEATSWVVEERRSLYSINDYDLETQSLKEEAICWSDEVTSLGAAGTSLPMVWLRTDGQEVCPALSLC